jgi:hypothetical protein
MEEPVPQKEESNAKWWILGGVAAMMAAAVWSERNHVGPHWYERSFEFWFVCVIILLAFLWFLPDALRMAVALGVINKW